MKKLPHQNLAEQKQKLLAKKTLLSRAIKVAEAQEHRARRKSRSRLAYLLGDVLVVWIEAGQADKRAVVDSVSTGVDEEKRALVDRLLSEFSKGTQY